MNIMHLSQRPIVSRITIIILPTLRVVTLTEIRWQLFLNSFFFYIVRGTRG